MFLVEWGLLEGRDSLGKLSARVLSTKPARYLVEECQQNGGWEPEAASRGTGFLLVLGRA